MSVPQENGVDSSEEDDLSAAELELVLARERRRAKSLPAYPEQAHVLLRALSHGCRKHVRFADALGLSLARVKLFSAAEEPRVPPITPAHPRAPALRPPEEPRGELELEARVRRCGLALERATFTCGRVHGIIRVSAATEVGVRYTLDEWNTYLDTRAVPVHALSPDTERYSFTVCASPHPERAADAVHFAVFLRGPGGEQWDNNDGQNYTLTEQHPICEGQKEASHTSLTDPQSH